MIVTTGNIPRARKAHKEGVPSPDAASTCTFSDTPTVGFTCESHCDFMDTLSRLVQKCWLQHAKDNKWTHCVELMNTATEDFCLPTTIGYQFCFRCNEDSDDIQIKAFFSMEGLGLAMEIVDGIGHHFMASAFSHHSCLPLHSTSTHVSCSNEKDKFLLVAWGVSGGDREAKEKNAREFVPDKKHSLKSGCRHVKATRQRGKRKKRQRS
jgi:hypothetical protein